MKINGVNSLDVQPVRMGMKPAADSVSRNLQRQIENAQKQLQELSAKEDMSLEEKMKKRQELQKTISNLNIQLRQHQMELQRESQRAKESTTDEMLGGRKKAENKSNPKQTGLSETNMESIISADSAMNQAHVYGKVANQLEGQSAILRAEIKQDGARGNVEAKEKELAELEQRATDATTSQISGLKDVDQSIKEAKEENRTEEEKEAGEKIDSNEDEEKDVIYTSVDIRL